MQTMTLVFDAGKHIRNAIPEAAAVARTGPVKFDWNGEAFAFEKGATEDEIRRTYEERFGTKILSIEEEEEEFKQSRERDRERFGHLIKRPASIDKAPETCAEALELWDAGEYVVAAEMGGLGPGYECAIQFLAFEVIRELVEDNVPEDTDAFRKWWGTECINARINCIFRRHDEDVGHSGAQEGAAANFAMIALRRGYRKALSELPGDRLIRARKPELPLND